MTLGLVVTVCAWALGLCLRQLAGLYPTVVVNEREAQIALCDLTGTPALVASAAGISFLLMLFWLATRAGHVATVGLGLFTGGAAANTTERLAFAGVVDYAPVPGTDGIVANFGDIAVTVGFALFAVALIRFHVARVIAASRIRRSR